MPMRFQSLDLNMGDNYVDKHRNSAIFFCSAFGGSLIGAFENLDLLIIATVVAEELIFSQLFKVKV